MRVRAKVAIGTKSSTAHAPWVNFVTAMTSATTAVVAAPTALMARPCRHPGSRSTRWCLAIPAWESVNEVKTPTAYSGMSRWTSARKATSRAVAARANPMMPFECTSRCPRLMK
ncbi:MAG: hypothetical protein KatS3mg014_0586 [Actinomycetota bacterium]|nr:MAG: hypothetical protein KatS3mg014_0586 [Actinomycetota bacterium]